MTMPDGSPLRYLDLRGVDVVELRAREPGAVGVPTDFTVVLGFHRSDGGATSPIGIVAPIALLLRMLAIALPDEPPAPIGDVDVAPENEWTRSEDAMRRRLAGGSYERGDVDAG